MGLGNSWDIRKRPRSNQIRNIDAICDYLMDLARATGPKTPAKVYFRKLKVKLRAAIPF